MNTKFDIFIAYSSSDRIFAEKLYQYLSIDSTVFLDFKVIVPGDLWNQKIAEAHATSLITLALISSRTEDSFYQMEEIINAISMHKAKNYKHNLIPLYINFEQLPKKIPYGLKGIQSIELINEDDYKITSQRVLTLLDELKGNYALIEYKKDGDLKRKKIFEGEICAIGRKNSSNIQFEEMIVSRQHASIFLTKDGLTVTDHNSKNSTFKNGLKISKSFLNNGDVIKLGIHGPEVFIVSVPTDNMHTI